MRTEIDYIILGGGLAGTCMARWLLARQQRVLIIHDQTFPDSSYISGGLMEAISGQFLTLTWRHEEVLPYAIQFYRDLENMLQSSFFHQNKAFRVFNSSEQYDLYQRKKTRPYYQSLFKSTLPASSCYQGIHMPFGGVELEASYQLRAPLFLTAMHAYFNQLGCQYQHPFSFNDLQVSQSFVSYKGYKAKGLICCEGAHVRHNPFFESYPFKFSKGELLDFFHPMLPEKTSFNGPKLLIPMSQGHFRIGSTYHWDNVSFLPSRDGYQTLHGHLSDMLTDSFQDHRLSAGVRCRLRDFRPIIGPHHQQSRIFIMNGLSGKGALHAPYLAQQLGRFILDQVPIPSDMSSHRFSHIFTPLNAT